MRFLGRDQALRASGQLGDEGDGSLRGTIGVEAVEEGAFHSIGST
jgi:hypothetical protein